MITIYSTLTCAQCLLVEKLMKVKKQEYVKIYIDDDLEQRERLFKITGYMKVPITTDGETYIVGYNPSQLFKIMS